MYFKVINVTNSTKTTLSPETSVDVKAKNLNSASLVGWLFANPDIRYPDLSANFMTVENPDFSDVWNLNNHASLCMSTKWYIKHTAHLVCQLSIYNSFPVIRTASAKNRRFHVPQPTFLFPLETPLRLSRNVLHGWKDNSMLAKPLAAC